MLLDINGERKISEIQKDFSTVFPFLKIEFFKNGNTRRDRYPVNRLIPHTRLLKDAWFWKKDKGMLEVNENTSVIDFENAMMDEFGLSAQVFRRSGNLWLETTMTDSWTLRQQNEHGREITIGIAGGSKLGNINFEIDRDANS